MREFSKKFTKPNEMDMKKIPKPRMEDFERRQQREREKHKRQQVQSVDREHALFPEPRRVNPSEGDDDITAKLGDHSKAIEFMNLNSVGIYGNALPLPNNAALAGNMPTSASSSAAAAAGSTAFGGLPLPISSLSSQRLQPPQQQQQPLPPPHHYQQQSQQQSRQLPYVKQTDNKPPYNGRGGYPGQPVKNDARSSSGMAPPKGPPSLLPPQFATIVGSAMGGGTLNSASSSLLPPPATTIMPNGHLGPPTSTVGTHNGRFSKPSIPKKPAVSRVDSALENILNTVNQTYRAPQEITKIAATPHTTIGEYNLNGPNRHKYTFDPIQPLGSPPSGADLLQSAPVTPITALPQPPTLPISSSAPVIGNMSTAAPIMSRSGETTQSLSQSVAPAAPATTTAPATAVARLSKEPLKPLTVEKVTPTLEKQNSTLLNDLELSESDDDRRKLSRSMHNSSDSSQSDSSESGSEESSKSEHQPAHSLHPPQQQQQSQSQQPLLHSHHSHLGNLSTQQQQQQQQQQPTTLTTRSAPNSLTKTFPSKLKGSDSNRSGIYPNSSTLGSAGSSSSGPSSTSSCNKTPSPSDSNKWNLSRYFNVNKAATQQTQNDVPVNSLVVNSMNVSMNEPTLLPGGAQIIPEPTPQQLAAAAAAAAAVQPNTAIVKNEASYNRAKNLSVQSDDEDDEDCNDGVGGATAGADKFRHPALLDDIKKESDTLFPNSLIKAAAAVAANGQSQGANQQVPMLNASEFVAIPSNQIKPEPYGGKRSPIVSPRTRLDTTANNESGKKSATGDEFVRIERLSAPSSDSNSSDANETNTSTVPTLGPGGTLKIPGVPAAITALPPSPPQVLASALAPTLPNSITVLPIDPLPPAQRRRQHRKQKPAPSRQRVDTSDEEEETVTATTTYKTGQAVTLSPVALRAVTAPGGKLYVDPAAVAPTTTAKKGPGRPRKLQSGNTTTVTTSNAIAATAKGPTLTAKKEVSGSGGAAKKAPSARRRVSRQNSIAASSAPTKSGSVAAVSQPPLLPKQLQQLQAAGTRVTREPSAESSCSTSSYSTSKSSSSSSSDSDAASGDGGAGSGSSSEDDEDQARQTTVKGNRDRLTVDAALNVAASAGSVSLPTTTTTGRRILQINKGKASLDDVVLAQPKLPVVADEDDDDDEDDTSSASSDDSSVTPAIDRIQSPAAAAAPTRTVPALGKTGGSATVAGTGSGGGGGSSHRSQNQQSPFKSAATVSTSSSSGSCSSSSSSSDGEHSDTELKTRGKAGSASAKRRRRDKPKASDKNKKDTLTRIFNPKEGGAKKQGQVLVIDQSGDQSDHQHQQQQQQQQQQQAQQQKLISPIIAFRRTGSQENLAATAAVPGAGAGVAQSSPRLTPGHLRSPRALPTQLLVGAHRTPDRCSSSAERKLQQRIKTPTRTPTRTPPNTRTPTPTPALGNVQHLPPNAATTASPARAAAVAPNTSGPSSPPSLICKIDLARIARIAPEWHLNSYRLYGSTPTAMYHHAGAGPPVADRRTAANTTNPHHYDHEAILNADLQAARLAAAASGSGNMSGGSGNGTPRSAGSRTPTTQGGDRDRERERGKQRLNYSHSNGRLSSRSADGGGGAGSGGSGDTTPKELVPPNLTPNGYTTARGLAANRGGSSSPKSTKLIAGLKHEHIKNEPDLDGATVAATMPLSTNVYCSETKFKAGGAGATAAVKQELLLKHDYKPVSEMPYATEKQLDASSVPVVAAAPEAKPRRKRSSSSSSSPYKEKKRKKDKHSKEGVATTANVMPLGVLPKDKEKEAEKKLDRMEGTSGGGGGGNGASSKAVAVITPLGMGNNGQMEKEILLLDNHQLPTTNHDRLLGKQAPMSQQLLHHHQHHPQQPQQQQQQSHLIGGSTNLSTATPAHLQPTSNKVDVIMPPPTGADGVAGVGALTHQQHDDKRPPPTGASTTATQAPAQQVIYHSYFERDDDAVNDIFSKNSKFLQEAISRKHAADREQNTFKQVILYLEAVVYFLLSGAAMEYHRSSEDATWTMYKDTLALIKFISSKFKHLTVPSSSNELHEPHHKVAVLSLRCQSLISLKLYKMKRQYCRSVINLCTEFFKSNRSEIINGNTPSSNSPSNSVCSQGSGSNTPPGKMLRQDKIQRQDIHSALNQENQYFNYLASCHELWDQADRLVRQGNHTDFFIALDHENGPLTLHSSMYEVFRYVQAGLERLKGGTTVTTTATATSTTNSNSNMSNVQH